MRVVIASDTKVINRKRAIVEWLNRVPGVFVVDCGPVTEDDASTRWDRPKTIAKAIRSGFADYGILLSSSRDMAVLTNSEGVQVASCKTLEEVSVAKKYGGMRVLHLPATELSFNEASGIVSVFITAPFNLSYLDSLDDIANNLFLGSLEDISGKKGPGVF